MICFSAVHGNLAFMGSFDQCIEWATQQCHVDSYAVVKLLKMRPNQNAKIIAEITLDGYRHISGGRCVNLKRLSRAAKNGEKKK